jgi:MFS family permease
MKDDRRFCCWTLYAMLLVFGWGYDFRLSGVAIAFPEFRRYYGNYYATGDQWVIPALWQSLWNTASTIGQVAGGFAAGQFADAWGRKFMLYTAMVISLVSSFSLVFAPSLSGLFVSRLLLGVSIGVSTVIPPLYVTENAPMSLRNTTSFLTNVIIMFRFFGSSLTGYGASTISGKWSFRLAFVMTFVPTIYLCGLPFFPESPVWYIKKGQENNAEKAVLRLFGPSTDVATHITTIKQELNQIQSTKTPNNPIVWRTVFTKEHRFRTLVAILGLQVQNFQRQLLRQHIPDLPLQAHLADRPLPANSHLLSSAAPLQYRPRLPRRYNPPPPRSNQQWLYLDVLVRYNRRRIHSPNN